jgi:hypothetical protein
MMTNISFYQILLKFCATGLRIDEQKSTLEIPEGRMDQLQMQLGHFYREITWIYEYDFLG